MGAVQALAPSPPPPTPPAPPPLAASAASAAAVAESEDKMDDRTQREASAKDRVKGQSRPVVK